MLSEIPGAAATLLTALIVAAAGYWGYSHQKRIDRETDVIKKRQSLYSDLLRTIMDMAGSPSAPDIQARYKSARAEIMLHGSDEVIRTMARFGEIIAVNDLSEMQSRGSDFAPKALAAYGSLVRSMRADVLPGSKLLDEEISTLAPFRRSAPKGAGAPQ